MDIRRRIHKARKGAELSQKLLGKAIGVTREYIIMLEKGDRTPSLGKLGKIIAACGMTEAEFFESSIPDKYPDPSHQELHESLQELLDAGYYEKMHFFIDSVVQTAPYRAQAGSERNGKGRDRDGPRKVAQSGRKQRR